MTTKGETLRFYPRSRHQVMFILVAAGSLTIALGNLMLLVFRFHWANAIVVLAMSAFATLCFRVVYNQSIPGRVYLELNRDEFIERSPLATFRRRWQDVESFAEGSDDGLRVVAYRLTASCRRWYHIWLKPGGGDGRLIQSYDLDPRALADLLESWRLRYAEKPARFHELD